MSNLVAKQITDKNGVNSTRWVKPDSEGAASASNIPAPVAVNEIPRSLVMGYAVEAFVTSITDEGDEDIDSYMEETEQNFSSFSTPMLQEIARTGETEDFIKMYGIKLMMEEGDSAEAIRDYANMARFMAENDYEMPEDVLPFTRSLQLYSGLTPMNENEPYPERRREQAEALLRVTIWL